MTAQTIRPAAATAAAGFTLLELLVVLAVTALVLAVSLPSLSVLQISGRARPLAATIQTDLKRARVTAMAKGGPVAFVLDALSSSYAIEGGRAQRLPRGTRLVWITQRDALKPTGERRITFYPDGSATSGNLIVEDERGQKITFHINGITGTATPVAQ